MDFLTGIELKPTWNVHRMIIYKVYIFVLIEKNHHLRNKRLEDTKIGKKRVFLYSVHGVFIFDDCFSVLI
jgi:fucose 4-O-acetylase-like acetyltransferase